jgi:uncharacterized membrane protein
MSERTLSILTILAAVSSGVMGGLFFIFSNTIMAALARIAPAGGIAAMQSINIVIQNPVFFLFFFGPALLSIVLAIGAVLGWTPGGHAWLYIGAAFYLLGIMGVTIAINVPMNDALAAVDPASAEGANVWTTYLVDWTRWNHVRTIAGIGSCLAYILALR